MELTLTQKSRLLARNWRAVIRMATGQYDVPLFKEDMGAFWSDPYPAMKRLRDEAPVAMMPIVETRMISRYADVSEFMGRYDLLSNEIPDDGMNDLMGHNLMRKDGDLHRCERKAMLPTIAPKTAKTHWTALFEDMVDRVLDDVSPRGQADFLSDIAMRICGEALRLITGLSNMGWQDIDRTSQAMIDALALMGLDQKSKKKSLEATAFIDAHIDGMKPELQKSSNASLISTQLEAGLSDAQIKANVRLAISGGQNEPRDVLCGAVYALLKYPEQREHIQSGGANWQNAFDEYVRWISPIGAAPRLVKEEFEIHSSVFKPGDSILFLISSAHRDGRVFDDPDTFDVTRETKKHLAFGKGPHFCAGAHPARALVADVALPKIFERLKGLRLTGDVPFGGWAFRGPLSMPVRWDVS